MPREILTQETQLTSKLASLLKDRNRVSKEVEPDRYESVDKGVEEARSKLNKFVAMLRDKIPAYAEVKILAL